MRPAVLFGVVLVLSQTTAGQDADTKRVVNLKLTVSAEDALKNVASAQLLRGLREIPEVGVSDKDHVWRLSVLLIGNEKDGYIGSLTVQTSSNALLVASLEPFPESLNRLNKAIDRFGPFYGPALGHILLTDKSLESLCRRIVAEFEVETFEPFRKARDNGFREESQREK